MNKQVDIIQELIKQFGEFDSKARNNDLNLRNFAKWLYERKVLFKEPTKDSDEEMHLNGELVFFLDALCKRFKNYTRKALSESLLISSDEFSFLIHLAHTGSYRKLEIIKMHLLETPSGIEIIRRLLGKSLIEEFDDPDDKRAKRIKITEKGSKELEKLHGGMMVVLKKMTGDFSVDEKMQLRSLLDTLNSWHENYG